MPGARQGGSSESVLGADHQSMARTLCVQCLQSFTREDVGEAEAPALCADCKARRLDRLAAAPSRVTHSDQLVVEGNTKSLPGRFLQEAALWCAGRVWLVRVPLLVYFTVVLVRHFKDPQYACIIDSLNFGIHELGHFAFRPLGEFMMVAGGTLAQLIVPVGAMFMFHRQRDFFAIACCLCWLSTSLFDVAVYCADARALLLDLAVPGMGVTSGGSERFHDWHRMLTTMGLLRQDTAIALLFRVAAVVSMLAGLGFGAWLCRQMIRRRAEGFPLAAQRG